MSACTLQNKHFIEPSAKLSKFKNDSINFKHQHSYSIRIDSTTNDVYGDCNQKLLLNLTSVNSRRFCVRSQAKQIRLELIPVKNQADHGRLIIFNLC